MYLIILKNTLKCPRFYQSLRFNSTLEIHNQILDRIPPYFSLCKEFLDENEELAISLVKSMTVYNDFISGQEEKSVLDEIEPYLKRMRYEFDHWDDAIHGYRETERLHWNKANNEIIDRVRNIAFPPATAQLKYVHILDLEKKGYIKPHIDAVRFCGDTIAGVSLLSDSVMRLVHDKKKNLYADVFLKRRSLYIMKNCARYDYTHEILSNENSVFKGEKVLKDRRISVICRNEPDKENK